MKTRRGFTDWLFSVTPAFLWVCVLPVLFVVDVLEGNARESLRDVGDIAREMNRDVLQPACRWLWSET